MTVKQAYVGMDLDTSGGSIVTAIIAAIQEDNEGRYCGRFAWFIKK